MSASSSNVDEKEEDEEEEEEEEEEEKDKGVTVHNHSQSIGKVERVRKCGNSVRRKSYSGMELQWPLDLTSLKGLGSFGR